MAYCVPVLPTALARWFLLVHNDAKPFASAEAQFSVKAIFSLSGVSDVVVFLLARQTNLLFGQSLGTRKLFNIPAPIRICGKFVCWTTRHALTALQPVYLYGSPSMFSTLCGYTIVLLMYTYYTRVRN